ncbi:hypothetical protein Srot_2986 [Segniliparus rotundus DSM 44985]|uniref:Lipoprotein n=1 Tax=Segniliparus rotundus (strain ATCC BAA-972 / CDC 1076 / CIP 108378 / DSM 44985 / JCM 13578) TaxID=640132 RepID=D6ZED8_SEGRD|nr:hypothetical protein [Segniliparus rotundus]ADG99414.1 hypothetical protein Srot_2986 [Segniliparus rotundus DSM 44985]
MKKTPAVFATVLALSGCGSHTAPQGHDKTPASAEQPEAGQAVSPRISDPEIGASYIVPKGYHRGKAEPSRVVLVLDGSPEVSISLRRLSKDVPDDAPFATMDANQSAEYVAKMLPKDERDVVLLRASWGDEDFPAAAVAVTAPVAAQSADAAGGPKRSLTYAAFLGKGEHKWMVRTSAEEFPDGVTPESLSSISEAFARSVKPLG